MSDAETIEVFRPGSHIYVKLNNGTIVQYRIKPEEDNSVSLEKIEPRGPGVRFVG
jgi:hypothetical protein